MGWFVGRRSARTAVTALAAAGTIVLAAGCGGSGGGGSSEESESITLAGPNQWNTKTSSFGPAWEKLVKSFEKEEPQIKLKTLVLPLKSFNKTLSTQLSAGTAPPLVFDQNTAPTYTTLALDKYLKQPNPYVPGNKQWIDLFRSKYYGFDISEVVQPADGKVHAIPFNMVGTALFYNKEAFKKAGVQAPLKTWTQFIAASKKLQTAGYTPMTITAGPIAIPWANTAIGNQLLAKYFNEWNKFDEQGKPGRADQLTAKSRTRAICTGQFNTKLPEVAEELKLLKQMLKYSTPNWNSVQNHSGALIGASQFVSGKTAMAWGTDYAKSALKGADFDYATMPFPTVTKETTPLVSGQAAQFGISGIGGTAYSISAKASDADRDAAIKFLQYVTAPKNNEPWIKATGALPVLKDVEAPKGLEGFLQGSWGEQPIIGAGLPAGEPGVLFTDLAEGYLIGSKSMGQTLAAMEQHWVAGAQHSIKENKWSDEGWAKTCGGS